MTFKEIDPVARDMLIDWLEAIETELNLEKPNIGMVIESIQLLVNVLTPSPDIFKVIKELESVKEGVLDPQN